MKSENFDMVAKTFLGLEGVLADELRALGARDVTEGNRVVMFTGDKEMMYRANFACRTAVRVLKPFIKLQSDSANDLYEQLKVFEWDTMMTVNTTFAIDATVYSENFTNSRFVTYRVKDAIADYFNDKYGKRPSIRVANPDVKFDVHISGNDVTVSLDSSGEPLFKRGWRVAQTDAPINEVLAAGMILLSGWKGDCDLVDPMCGSGTFLVEAALIGANIAPGVYRQSYAFQQWADYDEELFDKIYNDDSAEREFTHKIYGSDIEGKAIAIARANVKNAGVARYVELERRDIADLEQAPSPNGILVTNPPYGERLRIEDIEELYRTLGNRLKHVFHGYQAWIINYDPELSYRIGLKPSVRYPLNNGGLDCELLEYVIFDGSYSDMRSRGEHIHNDDFRASERSGYYRDHQQAPQGEEATGSDSETPTDEAPHETQGDGEQPQRREFGDRPPRREFGGNDRPQRREFGDRPPRREFGDNARPQRREFSDRPQRREFGDNARPQRREFSDRPQRREFGDNARPQRREFGDRPQRREFDDNARPQRREFGDRPQRREFGDNERPQRREFGDRPPRREFGDNARPQRREFGDRPPRREFGDNARPQRRDEDRHSDWYARTVLRDRQPQLGSDKEVPIIHGRRKSWKRQDLPSTPPTGGGDDAPTTTSNGNAPDNQ